MKRMAWTPAIPFILALTATAAPLLETPDTPVGLRVTSAVPVPSEALTADARPSNGFLFQGRLQCDGGGNLFLVPLPFGDPNAVNPKPQVPGSFVRVSADGKKATRVDLSAARTAGDALAVLSFVTLDAQGNVHALARLGTERKHHQYIVTFDNKGRYKSKTQINPDEIQVLHFGAFASGEYLVFGRRRTDSRAVTVVMGPSRPMREIYDVVDPAEENDPFVRHLTMAGPMVAHMAPGTDGNIYVVAPSEKPVVLGISPSGAITSRIQLEAPRNGISVEDLRVSNGRLAVFYKERKPDSTSSHQWISVFDLGTGAKVASYGPVEKIVMCYAADPSGDRFTLLDKRDGKVHLVSATTP